MNSSHFQIFFSQFEDFWKTETAKKRGIFFLHQSSRVSTNQLFYSFTIWVWMWWQMGERWSDCSLSLSHLQRIISDCNSALSLASIEGRLQLFFCDSEWRSAPDASLKRWVLIKAALFSRGTVTVGGRCDLRGSFCVEENQLWFQPSQQSLKEDGVQHRGTSVIDTMGGFI